MQKVQLDAHPVNPLVPRHNRGVLLVLQVFLTPEIVYINDGEPARPKANRRVTQSLVIV